MKLTVFSIILFHATLAFAARNKGGAIGQKLNGFMDKAIDLISGPIGWFMVAMGLFVAIAGVISKRTNGSEAANYAIVIGVCGVLLGMVPQIADEFMGAGALMPLML